MTRRAAIYVRVSTAEQAEHGTGLTEQVEACEARCQAEGWEVVARHVDDGVSGTVERRPALDALLEQCARGDVDVVVVHRLNRLARSTRVALNLLHRVAEDGVGAEFVSVKEAIDTTTPAGKLQQNVLLVFAEFDRDSIVEQTSAGLRQRVRQGLWPGGPPPFGYRLAHGPGGSTLEADPDEARVIAEAARLVADEGLTTWGAAAELNRLGLAPREADRWNHIHLRRVLSEPRYSGRWLYKTARHGVIELEVPVLIPPGQWERLQAKLAAASTGPRTATKFYLLSRGLLRSACGSTYSGLYRGSRGYRQYRCRNARTEAGPDRCGCGNIRADDIESAVWDSVSVLVSDPGRVLALADAYFGAGEGDEDAASRLAEVRREVAGVEEALGRASATLLEAGAGAAAIKAANVALTDKLAHLRELEVGLAERVDRVGDAKYRAEGLKELARLARNRLAMLSLQERREVLELLSVEVEVTGWVQCGGCDGRKKVRGGTGGGPCEVCHQLGRTPQLAVTGAFTAEAVAANVWHQDGEVSRHPGGEVPDVPLPFRLRLGAA